MSFPVELRHVWVVSSAVRPEFRVTFMRQVFALLIVAGITSLGVAQGDDPLRRGGVRLPERMRSANQVVAPDGDTWLMTRDGTFATYGYHLCAMLSPGTPIPIRRVKDGSVESALGGWIPLTDLMTPADAINLYTQRIENSLFEFSAVDAHILRGKSYFAAQLYAQAIEDYNFVLRREPRNAEALLQRGIAHERMGAVGLACADYDATVKAQPRLAEAWYRRCVLNARAGRLEAAAADLGEIVRLNKRDYSGRGYDPATWQNLAARVVQEHFEAAGWTAASH